MALKKINYNGQSKIILRLCEMVNQLIDGGGGGGSTVTYTQTLQSGTKTGEISIDGVSTDMYAPTQPTALSDLTNDEGFINNTVDNLTNYYLKSDTDALLADKVDKVAGKQLSTEDFTSALKTKLDGIATGAEVNVQSDWNQSDSSADDFIKNKPTIPTDFVSKANGGTFEGNIVVDRKNGTASKVGDTYLGIGNDTPSGTAGNSRGILRIYSNTGFSGLFLDNNHILTGTRFYQIPDKSGTLALTSDISSRKFKENINEFTDEEAKKLLDVEMVTFDYKEGITGEDERYDNRGVIAEQVEPIIPYVVEHETIEDEEQMRVDYRKFIPYLIKMVQIQQKEIEELKAIINAK